MRTARPISPHVAQGRDSGRAKKESSKQPSQAASNIEPKMRGKGGLGGLQGRGKVYEVASLFLALIF